MARPRRSQGGTSELDADQIVNYLEIAKANGIDAVVTLSNQFTSSPNHHPVVVPTKLAGKVPLYHWSWMHVLTYADLLITNNGVADVDQRFVLEEMRRFLTHQSAGVRGYESMPAEWPELVQALASGASVVSRASDAKEVMGAWYQLTRDLSLMLSRQSGSNVEVRLNRQHTKMHEERLRDDIDFLASAQCIRTSLVVPEAAAPLGLMVDLRARAITASMKVAAPEDKQSVKAKLNWLLRQIPNAEDAGTIVRLHWSGRGGGHTQHSLADIRKDPERPGEGRDGAQLAALEICVVRQIGNRFAQRRNFIVDLEMLVSDFYVAIGQKLKAWQPSAPKVRDDRSTPQSVDPAGLQLLIDPFLSDELQAAE